jgi:uncharacterized protein (UPF0335 family)
MEGTEMTLAAVEQNTQDTDSNTSTGPTSVNGVKADELKRLIDRIENLEERKTGMMEDIKLVNAEAKAEGFDIKTVNTILKLRKMDTQTIEQEELLLEVYKRALGMTD